MKVASDPSGAQPVAVLKAEASVTLTALPWIATLVTLTPSTIVTPPTPSVVIKAQALAMCFGVIVLVKAVLLAGFPPVNAAQAAPMLIPLVVIEAVKVAKALKVAAPALVSPALNVAGTEKLCALVQVKA